MWAFPGRATSASAAARRSVSARHAVRRERPGQSLHRRHGDGYQLVRHGGGGEMLMQVLNDGATMRHEMLAIDRGRGMEMSSAVMRDGYSTGGTPGPGSAQCRGFRARSTSSRCPARGTVALSLIGSHSRGLYRFRHRPFAVRRDMHRSRRARSNAVIPGGSPTRLRLERDGGGRLGTRSDGRHGGARGRASVSHRPFDDPSSRHAESHAGLARPGAPWLRARGCTPPRARVDYAGIGNIYGSIVVSALARAWSRTTAPRGCSFRGPGSSPMTGLRASSW